MDTLSPTEYRDLAARRMPEAGRNGWQERVRRIATLEARATPEGAWDHYHTHTSRFSAKGFPDGFAWRWEQMGVTPRLRLVIYEAKRVGGKVTPEQDRWLTMFRTLSRVVNAATRLVRIEVYVWTPLDEAEVRRVFLERAG